MFLDETQCVFYISNLLKTSCLRFHRHPLEFKVYPAERTVCAVTIFKAYLQKTEMLRHDSSPFISYVPPHKGVTSKTQDHWLI